MSVAAQESSPNDDADEPVIDEARKKFIRVGIDPSRFLLTFLQPADRGGFEVQVDMELWDQFYPVVEIGYMFADRVETGYTLHVGGTYGRLGMDYNLLKPKEAKDRDIFFVGLRVATSRFIQGAERVYYENAFGNVTTSIPDQSITAFWSEVAFGVKAEVFHNFFVGWTGRIKYKFKVKDTLLTPYAIPGYGRLRSESNINADFNIYLSYSFSL